MSALVRACNPWSQVSMLVTTIIVTTLALTLLVQGRGTAEHPLLRSSWLPNTPTSHRRAQCPLSSHFQNGWQLLYTALAARYQGLRRDGAERYLHICHG
jgi:hypothetical protein